MHPIPAASTTTAVFVGTLDDGPASAREVTGAVPGDTPLARALSQFFLGGARTAWVVPDIAGLDEVPSPSLVAMPELSASSGDPYRDTLRLLVQWCAAHRAFLIVDPPANWKTADDAEGEAGELAAIVQEKGALYWPMLDANGNSIPPSGAVAAACITNDESRGVWMAPAGTSLPVPGATPQILINERDASALSPLGVNALRSFPSFGTLIWGARTLADGDWKYVPVRRLTLFIESSLIQGLQWTAFEPNTPSLWAAVRASVESFLAGLWKQGAFTGSRAGDAYFVLCDATTMTQDDIDNGRLNVVIGIAPTRPAEFVIIRIGLWTAQPSSVSSVDNCP